MVDQPNSRRAWAIVFTAVLVCLAPGAFGADTREARPGSISATPGGAPALPASVDLRPVFEKWGLTPRTQGKRGTCSVFTLAGALEFAAAVQQRHGERLSVEFLNWGANRIAGKERDGGFFSDLCRAYAVYGICSEKAMPYGAEFGPAVTPAPQALADAKSHLALGLCDHWIKEWDVKTGLTETQFIAIQRTLSQGWPVCAGLRWPMQPRWSDNVLQMCSADAVFDGHSVLIIGYRNDSDQPGGGVFFFRNTGDGGRDSSMPYAYARTYINDAVWINSNGARSPGVR